MKLHIAKDLALPLDVVTQTIAILAKRRAGKSYTMRRLVEQLFKARQQVVLVDPKGDQWGIRSAADGKAPGLAVVILGGERGDVPLEPSSGEVVAKLVVEERVSVVLDLSLFRKNGVASFMTGFLENLYRLKAKEVYRTPVMLVIDEADAIAPQKPQKGQERMLGAAEDIVRRGGQRGIGCVLVSQRSAVLNKNVLTQAQMLVALRTIAPQDLDAMDDWIKVHGEPGQRELLMESLPSLPIGDAWFWSPGWPTIDGIFKRVHVLPIETFDSGATPKPGEKRAEPKSAADVDLEALKRQMEATIERAKADNPKALRAELARVKAELAKKPTAAPAGKAKPAGPRAEDLATINALRKALENAMKFIVQINTKGFDTNGKIDQEALQKAVAGAAQQVASIVERHVDQRNKTLAALRQQGERVVKDLQALLGKDVTLQVEVRHNEPFTVTPTAARPARQPAKIDHTNPELMALAAAQRKILNALAFLEQVGISPADRTQASLFADLSPTAGHTNNMFGGLRTAALIEYPTTGMVLLTDAGRTLADPGQVPQSAEDMQQILLAKVAAAQRKILAVLIEAYPEALDRREASERAGLSPDAGHTNNMYGGLRSMGLIEYPAQGRVVAQPVLFLEAR